MEEIMKKWLKKNIIFMLCFTVLFTSQGSWLFTPQRVKAAAALKVPGKVKATNLNVRISASRKAKQLVVNEKKVALKNNTAVTILSEKMVSNEKWYYISFPYENTQKKGYVLSDYIQLTLKKTVPAKINSKTAVKIRTGAGEKKSYLKVNNKVVSLKNGAACTILKEVTAAEKKWFQVQFTVNKKKYKGYIQGNQLLMQAAASAVTKTGKVNATSLNVRKEAGTDKEILTYEGKIVRLPNGEKVTITGQKTVDKVIWYKITFTYQGKKMTGYVSGEYIILDGENKTPTPIPTKSPVETNEPGDSEEPEEGEEPGVTQDGENPGDDQEPEETQEPVNTPEPTPTPAPTPVPSPMTEAEFEQSIGEFPEDYKGLLRQLHEKYPLWRFKAVKTGLDWNTVIANESKIGKNLIANSKGIEWKSTEQGAYNWETDTFIPFDSTTWVTASKAAVEYYMDPRNFLTTFGIFQFEELSYNSSTQTLEGVETILKGTALANASYSYKDENGSQQTITYGETFIKAAQYSGVNPYHLATRVKQEVITSSGLSSSAAGKTAGYEGYYNFYNIGATHSNKAGGSITNALKFAKNGTGVSAANKKVFLLPWNSPYNAIVGGAKFIGNNYINRGQNTVYTQKFNITAQDRYDHQYMANVEAPKAEAQKTYNAYKDMTDVSVVFNIPVYENMPSSLCQIPANGLNPNNWLKSLTVENYTMSPEFHVTDKEGTVYTVSVPNGTNYVSIDAQTVSGTANIEGSGDVSLKSGTNKVQVIVTSQAGTQRTYTIQIIQK